ncbi:glycosyltransferase [Alistipes sp. An116]|uniref:glycosyltransferase n=1 Tax=Alistipes sp. An116 TaxID=1965546 RepID=UPI000B3749A4|nr:glycosyltransferase [Alistipes sp. An116]OUQ53972.1 glycosyltransferase [Alistipes sp. An116]
MDIKTIAFLNWRYPGGGGETVTHHLGHFFLKYGYRILVYGDQLNADLITEADRQAFTIHAVPHLPNAITVDKQAFCESLKKENVDCLIVQGITNAPFEEIRRQVGCKIIFCLHSIPMWEVYAIRNKRVQDLLRKDFGYRMEFLLIRRPLNRLTNKPKRRTLRTYANILPYVDRMVMLCPEYRQEMEQLLRNYLGPKHDIPASRFLSIPNPLLPPEEPVHTHKEKIVLYVGRLCYEDKRVDRLLRIWHQIEQAVPDWKLLILGQGDEKEQLEKMARRLKLRHVEFSGYQTNVAPYYRRATFVCLTSNFEGLPMSLLEGQQYGAIPVSFDSFAAIHSITCHGQAGIEIPAFSERAYAQRLKEAMLDEEAQTRMREQCYLQATNYDLERIGEEWLRLFKELN